MDSSPNVNAKNIAWLKNRIDQIEHIIGTVGSAERVAAESSLEKSRKRHLHHEVDGQKAWVDETVSN